MLRFLLNLVCSRAFPIHLFLVQLHSTQSLVQIIVGGLLWPPARSKVRHIDGLLAATLLDAQEALVRVGLAIAAADRLVLLRAHFRASLEGEGGQTPLQRHDEHVLAAILLPHVALRLVELVVGAADEAAARLVALGLAVRRHHAVLQGDGHDAQATRLLLHFAEALVGVAVAAAHRRLFLVLRGTLGRAVRVVLSQARARSNVGHLYAAPVERGGDCIILATE